MDISKLNDDKSLYTKISSDWFKLYPHWIIQLTTPNFASFRMRISTDKLQGKRDVSVYYDENGELGASKQYWEIYPTFTDDEEFPVDVQRFDKHEIKEMLAAIDKSLTILEAREGKNNDSD